MKLAFYYHIPIVKKEAELNVPSYLGVFIDSLAKSVEELYLVLHQANYEEAKEADYTLISKNIRFIDLGTKTPAWHRAIFHQKILKKSLKQIETCDVFLVRSPSPLAPYFKRYINRPKLIFLVVGDYAESVIHEKATSFRQWVTMKYLVFNDYLFRKAMLTTDTIVNSPVLFAKYKPTARSIHQIKTTTLSEADFFYRNDTCLNSPIHVLYTGRIDPLKGLFELVEAIAQLSKKNMYLILDLVGWESVEGNPVEKRLKEFSRQLGIEKKVVFHGKKSIGEELNEMYRMADIYVIPSYEEGFPRTIWEAMANSLPVVATRVGAIPRYLKDGTDAIFIEPKKTEDITRAIEILIKNPLLRQTLIRNGMKQAESNTLQLQTQNLLDIIKNL